MTPKERLQYALYMKRLHELFVIKENIAFEYQHKNYNKAAAQIDNVVDKMLNENIEYVVDGTVSLKSPKVDHIIEEALINQQEMLVKNPNRFIQQRVQHNTKIYKDILQNRIEKENYSLQQKILDEYEKRKNEKISEEQLKKELKEKFADHGRKRSKNIVKDALHTNQSNMSWIHNMGNGAKYKVWMNGQSISGVRLWHVASLIQPCYIDDYFDILYGSAPVQMMYPGDLYGGAENVANCKCWVYYTNVRPKYLKVGKNYMVKEPYYEEGSLSTISNRIDKVIRRVKKLSPFKNKYEYDTNNESYNIPKKYKQFKGKTKNGLLPNGERISKYFSKDVTKTTIFDRIIDEWTCTPFDKEMRIFSDNKFNIRLLRNYLINDKDVPNKSIPRLIEKAKRNKKRMEHLMEGVI